MGNCLQTLQNVPHIKGLSYNVLKTMFFRNTIEIGQFETTTFLRGVKLEHIPCPAEPGFKI